MFVLFFLIWVIFNGQLTAEIAAFGVVIAGVMYLFLCKFLNYHPRYDLFLLKKSPLLLRYLATLILEILKANLTVFRLIYTAEYELEPAIVSFRTDLRSTFARVLLANSITLTPGTITVSLEDDCYTVHCLDKELAAGISSSVFVEQLKKIEGGTIEK
ncbi:MAG: Na+/H+ antiporter subunit E [Bacteroidales bacterium]|nr:Na+/H+ antiporter subunit E [Bacteroidales bacterium]MCM1416599.1 Na+/H+ antiporter subunit E [bacterium]MCM1424821.1 Na+/H+ antiporter subunit E [bacterium]